ncbi:MAG: undecaprenyl/decaprenyl-phosphate alpha-N-acetylglucosaminyl 1-phosphate transferase [Flavobacteriaceae bacterium TMED42]|nr:MAG: undecaprenyl/decaprenyl-phosphate alpha-N-acetylglucosaminyl 1-phosphate transferase [Flavobacteriaceae bacterium TMED42]
MIPLSYFVILLISLVISYGLKLWFTQLQKFDAINHRSVHQTKATKTGGIAVFLSLFLFSLYYYFQSVQIFDFSLLIPLGIMFMVGVYDDFYNADFKLKFFLQIIVAKILIDQGFVIDNFHGVLGLQEIPRLASQIFTVFVFLVIVNAFNFIDGIDGLAITEAIKVIVLVEFFSLQSTPLFSLGMITALSLLPLYYFNFKKDYKVFLGDAGSLFLGTLIASYLFYVLGSEYTLKPDFSANKPLLTMSLIAYPLVDLLRVFIIRIRNKKSPFSPDQNHLHHLLIKKGYPHFVIVLIILILSLIFLLLPFGV